MVEGPVTTSAVLQIDSHESELLFRLAEDNLIVRDVRWRQSLQIDPLVTRCLLSPFSTPVQQAAFWWWNIVGGPKSQ